MKMKGRGDYCLLAKVEDGVCPAAVPQRKCVLCWLRFALHSVPPS